MGYKCVILAERKAILNRQDAKNAKKENLNHEGAKDTKEIEGKSTKGPTHSIGGLRKTH
jgi:hypothetical protein